MSDATTRPIENQIGHSTRTVLTIILGALLMTVAAKAQIPFWPVPMTLHTLAVMAFAVAFGPRIAVAIFLTYLAVGAAGLPVFSGSPQRGIGFAYMVGPTGGYLLGYLIASGLVGALARGRGVIGRTGAMLVGLSVVYVIGAAWLANYVPIDQVLALGVIPFVAGDLAKLGIVAGMSVVLPASRDWVRNAKR